MNSSPNRTTRWLGAALVFLAMAALGWKLGDKSSVTAAPMSGKTGPAESAAEAALAKARQHSDRARQRVSGIRLGPSSEQRLRATIELANTLSTGEFADWIDNGWFDHRSGFELTLFRRIVEERWRLEDPEGFVAWCLKDGQNSPGWSVSNPKGAALPLLTDWALHHPDRLGSFFAKHPDDTIEAQLISGLAAGHPEVAIARLKEMLGRGASRNNYQLTSSIAQLAKAAPDAVEAILADLPASLRIQAETVLVGQRLTSSFRDEIRDLWERPDGWQLFSNNLHQIEGLSARLLEELPNLPNSWRHGLTTHSLHNLLYNGDPEPWFRADLQEAGFTAEQAQRIRATALSALTSKNPELALELLPDAGLDENARRNVISNLFHNARADPEKAESWLAMLGSDAERETARGILESGSQNTAGPLQTLQTPDAWIEGVLAHDPGQSGFQFGHTLQQWSHEQVTALAERFRDLPAGQKDKIVSVVNGENGGGIQVDSFAPALAGEVVRHMLTSEPSATGGDQQPVRNPATRMASSTAVRWVVQDAAAASAWVGSLPEGEAKIYAQRNMAATWANYDPQAMENWLRTLPPEARTEVRGFVAQSSGN